MDGRALARVPGVMMASALVRPQEAPSWSYLALAGRLAELSSKNGSAMLSLAMKLVSDTHRHGEPAAWVTARDSAFFPPDAAEHGVDLESLVVVRVSDAEAVPRAGDTLVRSGAFGLVVLDLGERTILPLPLLSRLGKLAEKHATAVLCLTVKPAGACSLGSLVSLHGEAWREQVADDSCVCEVRVMKDKYHVSTWIHREVYRGPVGLRQHSGASFTASSCPTP